MNAAKSEQEPTEAQIETLLEKIDPKTFESISPKDRPKIAHLVAVIGASFSRFSGPLPPPEILARYNEIVPGSAERIITMAEDQSRHRQQIEARVIDAQIRQSNRGQWMALVIAISFLAGSLLAALTGHETTACVLGGGTVISLAGAFIAGKVQQSHDLAKKLSGSQRQE